MVENLDETTNGSREAKRSERAERALVDHTSDPQRIETAYRARAAALARPLEAARGAGEIVRAAVFRLGSDRFAAPLLMIERVIPDPACSPLPGADERWAGVIADGGEILPVLHLQRVLGLPASGPLAHPHVLKLRSAAAPRGLLVGEVLEIRGFEASGLQPAGESIRLVEAVAPGNVLILDIESLMAQEITQ